MININGTWVRDNKSQVSLIISENIHRLSKGQLNKINAICDHIRYLATVRAAPGCPSSCFPRESKYVLQKLFQTALCLTELSHFLGHAWNSAADI